MAGFRQHYIPQFLQQGFVANRQSSKPTIWMHRKGYSPREIGVRDSGVEKYFYSHEQESEIDEKITNFERIYSSLITQIDEQNPKLNANEIALLLAHFETRTRHIRLSLQESADFFVTEFIRYFDSKHLIIEMVNRMFESRSDAIFRPMEDELSRLGMTLFDLEKIGFSEEAMKQTLINSFSIAFSHLKKKLEDKAKDIGKSGHLKALSSSISPIAKVMKYSSLNYSVMHIKEPKFVLGDSIILFEVVGSRKFKPFLDKSDELVVVYLPLSPTSILVGSKKGSEFYTGRIKHRNHLKL